MKKALVLKLDFCNAFDTYLGTSSLRYSKKEDLIKNG
jgi:hypothetical protein